MDIDTDFETDRRDEVIAHVLETYPGQSAQVASYGLYKTDSLLNDLFKVCGVDDKDDQATIKRFVKQGLHKHDELIPLDTLLSDSSMQMFKKQYCQINDTFDDILKHFYAMHNKVRYYGTHAAGVAITATDITDYTALKRDKNGKLSAVHDLVDLERIGVVKFDMLGLKTLNIIKDLREETGVTDFDETWAEDQDIIDVFSKGNTDGVFQFDRSACQDILVKIDCDCFEDIIATNAMNRPASLKLQMPDVYAEHKQNQDDLKSKVYWEYVKKTYGCIVYQEQVLNIAINIAGFTADEADILVKMEKGAVGRTKQFMEQKYYEPFHKKFVKNAVKNGVEKEDAENLFAACAQYGFGRGHATAYSLLAIEEAYYLTYHPAEYFFAKIKYAMDEAEQERFCAKAFVNDVAVFIPHINFSESKTCMRVYEGEKVIQKGLSTIKGVGEKAADFIVNERQQAGKFKNEDDFIDRCKCRAVTSRVISLIHENGCAEMNHKKYLKRVQAYNSALYLRGVKHG